jgi:hypothetical protein
MGKHQKTNQPQKYTDKHRIVYIVKDKNKLTTEERDGRTQKRSM